MKRNSKYIFHDNRTQTRKYIKWHLILFFHMFVSTYHLTGNIMTSNVNIVLFFSFVDVLPMGQRASLNQQYILCNNK